MKQNKKLNEDSELIPGLIAILIMGVYFIIRSDHHPNISIVFNLFLFSIFLYLNIYIHEMGHFVAAYISGIKVYSIQIGSGNIIWHQKIFNINFDLTDKINGGYTLISNVPLNHQKIRIWIMTAGGIGLQFIFLLLIILLFGFSPVNFLGKNGVNFTSAFILSNLLMIILNLIPTSIKIYDHKIPNDGKKLFTLPFWKTDDIQKLLQVNKFYEANKYFELKEYLKSEIAYKKLISQAFDMPAITINLALVYIKELKFQEAIDELISFDHHNNSFLEAFKLNNLAWAYLLLGGKEAIEKANEYSATSMKLHGELNSMKGTRGCILIEMGKIEQGISILNEIVNINRPIQQKTNTPINLAYLALAYHLLGDIHKSNKVFEKINRSEKLIEPDEMILYKRMQNIIKSKIENAGIQGPLNTDFKIAIQNENLISSQRSNKTQFKLNIIFSLLINCIWKIKIYRAYFIAFPLAIIFVIIYVTIAIDHSFPKFIWFMLMKMIHDIILYLRP